MTFPEMNLDSSTELCMLHQTFQNFFSVKTAALRLDVLVNNEDEYSQREYWRQNLMNSLDANLKNCRLQEIKIIELLLQLLTCLPAAVPALSQQTNVHAVSLPVCGKTTKTH
mmetsp:Transcript_12367/g.23729  ORF Transcript_12367/g.23729 Transcript_12367/m.23729 type:complete len:112 (-) Transcript_12367:1960-2295(-)